MLSLVRRLALLAAAMAVLAAAPTAQPEPRVAVVQFSDRLDLPQDAILKQAHATLMKSLPRSRAQVLRLDPTSLPELERLVKAGVLTHLEVADQKAAQAIPPESVSMASLGEADQTRVRVLTGQLGAGEFRISESRPQLLSADLLDAAADGGQPVTISLLGGRSVSLSRTARMTRRTRDDFTWEGDSPDGRTSATLIVRPQGVTGIVEVAGETFSILPLQDGRQLVLRTPARSETPEHPPDLPSGAPPPPEAAADEALCTPEGTEADVFVGYTAAAERFTADVEGLILLFTQVAQDVFQGSQTNANVRLAGTERWPYTETGSLRTDLAALTALPEARLARDRASADVVLMLVAGGDACGLASAIRATPSNAFAVVALQPTCPASRMSFTHEIGHLYGNRHDLGADPTVSPFRDGHGFAHVSARDVMATDFACNGCPRRKFFSNPNIAVDNRPLGDPTCCNNARVIREETGATVPRFKCRNP